jgi:hypothetical protein
VVRRSEMELLKGYRTASTLVPFAGLTPRDRRIDPGEGSRWI